jgi:hypothetical protein
LRSTGPLLCWRMAAVDPARARRCIESMAETQPRPELYLILALGSKARDGQASREAFQAGLNDIDRQLRERPVFSCRNAGTLLPIVERIDPGLVLELFWRDVSARLPIGNPRSLINDWPTNLNGFFAWYDREVAAALFELVRARIDLASGDQSADWTREFLAWSLFDPRAAVARLETLSIDPKLPNNAIRARLAVAESLAQDHEQRWRKIWEDWDIILGGLKRDF